MLDTTLLEPAPLSRPAPGFRTPSHTPKPSSERLQVSWLHEIKKTHIEWLWKPFLQAQAINILTGDPGVGKSTLCCDIIARLSRGEDLPFAGERNHSPLAPQTSWILNSEDSAADTIAWRLENQGADPSRVLVTDALVPITPQVVRQMGDIIRQHRVRLLVLDPLQAWMGAEVDMHRANETRQWGGLLKNLCLRYGCTILLVRHRRKSTAGQENTLYSGMGSIDITGMARSEFVAVAGKEGLTYVQRIKGNVGSMGEALAYTLDRHPDPRNDHGVLRWVEVPAALQAAVAAPQSTARLPSRTPKALNKAKRFLGEFLASGPQHVIDVIEAATKIGLSASTLKRAREGMVQVDKVGEKWFWSLTAEAAAIHQPPGNPEPAQAPQPPQVPELEEPQPST